jgi:hypothetical protein
MAASDVPPCPCRFCEKRELRADDGFWFNWIAENYADATLTAVRRELDVEGSPNLRNLLDDIIQHPRVLTRRRYVAQWGRGEGELASSTFDTFRLVRTAGSPADDHVDPAAVRMDLSLALGSVEHVRRFGSFLVPWVSERDAVESVAAKIRHKDAEGSNFTRRPTNSP